MCHALLMHDAESTERLDFGTLDNRCVKRLRLDLCTECVDKKYTLSRVCGRSYLRKRQCMQHGCSSIDKNPTLFFLSRANSGGDDTQSVGYCILWKFWENLLESFDHTDLRQIFTIDLGFESW